MESVLITGGSGGIGAAAVRTFEKAGIRPLVLDIKPPRAGDVAHRVCDLTGPDVEECVHDLAGRRLHHVLSIAGGAVEPEQGHSEAQLHTDGELPGLDLFRQSVELNLTAHYRVIAAALPHLREAANSRHQPSVTVVSSINALAAYGLPAYSAAKAGLHGLVAALCAPLGADGIRINALAPGTVKTPRTVAEWNSAPGHFEALEASTALDGLATPQSIARTLLAITTELRDTTGQVIVADRGQLMQHSM